MSLRYRRSCAAWTAVAALVIQPQLLLAAPLPNDGTEPIRVVDVELGTNGVLRGQLVDRQGRQLPISQVQVTNGHQTRSTYSNKQGNFLFEGLVGSTYQVQAAGNLQIVRAWAKGTAPPKALDALLIVHDSDIVLGQHCGSPVCGNAIRGAKHPLSNPFILGGIVATAVAIPVAIHNRDKDGPVSPN